VIRPHQKNEYRSLVPKSEILLDFPLDKKNLVEKIEFGAIVLFTLQNIHAHASFQGAHR